MSEENEKKQNITYKYVIPGNLRDCYINGVWGSVSTRGEVHMHLYSERLPIPTLVVHEIENNEIVQQPSNVEIGGDVLRLVQASVVMDIPTAVALHRWLGDRITYYLRMQNPKDKGTDE